jgi:ABC-type amino acid transport substrate-binding protein
MISTTEFLGVSGLIQFSNNTTDRINGTYYMVYNVQPSANGLDCVPILQCSNSDDWEAAIRADVILWPGSSLVPPTGLPGLSGVTLRIGVIQAPPFTMITNVINTSEPNTTKLIGYVPDLIEILRNRMGFIPEIILAPSNQTYDALVQAVANSVYDIVVGDVTVTAKRREIVDFSYSFFDNSVRIIVRQSTSVDVDLFSYLKPFSVRLWLAILAVLLYAAVLICILERQENEAMKNKSIVSSIAMSVWYAYGTMTGYGADFHVRTAAGRLLSVGLYLMSIILVATYTANLASNLTSQKTTNIISGIEDIKNGKLPFSRIGILVGSSLEDYYLREISKGSQSFYPLKSVSQVYGCLLNNTIDASILDTAVLEYATSTLYCNLTLIGADFDPSAYGIVTPKEWVYAQALDLNILSLRESGALDDLKRKWFEGKICSDPSVIGTAISIEAASGLFLTFAIVSILSLLLFIWLKGFIIKDYLWALLHRKRWLVQQDSYAGRLLNRFHYEPYQIYHPDSISSLTSRM